MIPAATRMGAMWAKVKSLYSPASPAPKKYATFYLFFMIRNTIAMMIASANTRMSSAGPEKASRTGSKIDGVATESSKNIVNPP